MVAGCVAVGDIVVVFGEEGGMRHDGPILQGLFSVFQQERGKATATAAASTAMIGIGPRRRRMHGRL